MCKEFGARTWWQVSLRLTLISWLAAAGLGICSRLAHADGSSIQAPAATQNSSSAGINLVQPDPPSHSERSLWSNFHLSGFLNETDGMWINPSNLRQFTPSRNSLATSRTWLQADENFRLDSHNEFFMREWFVYEPPYPFNYSNNFAGTHMQALNDFYNQYAVRDAWWKFTAGPLTLYTGNQIVVWGQSLAFRVGDVINPQDTNWNFGFANLEQSRMPQWMLHPIVDLPDLGPLTSNFVEGVLIPGAQPLWNSVDHPDGRYAGEYDVAGRVSNGFPAANHGPSAIFDVHYPYLYPGRTISTNGVYTGSDATGFASGGANMIAAPFSRAFYYCNQLNGLVASLHQKNPVPLRMRKDCNLSQGAVHLTPWHIPAVTLGNMEEGIRLHTLIGSNEITALYFNTYQYYPVFSWVPYTGNFPALFEPVQYMGMTWDRPVPMPASLAEYFPLVARAEAVYQNHAPFVNFDVTELNAVKYADVLTYMVALDLDQAYAPWLTSTGNLSANLEFLDMVNLEGVNNLMDGPNGADISTNALKNDVSILFNIGTSYWWNAVQPTWTMIYSPYGTTFAFFPSIQFNPPWTNKYFARIGLVYVLGSAINYVSPGLFKGENLITISGQYNFSAL
jgi:hypothetical protein